MPLRRIEASRVPPSEGYMFGWFTKRSRPSSVSIAEPSEPPNLPVMREIRPPTPLPVAPPAPPERHAQTAHEAAAPSEPVLAELTSRDSDMRVAAARELGRSGDPEAAAPLADALRDAHPSVRIAAAHALGKLCEERSIDALAGALNDEDHGVQAAARGALRAIGTARAQAALEAPPYRPELEMPSPGDVVEPAPTALIDAPPLEADEDRHVVPATPSENEAPFATTPARNAAATEEPPDVELGGQLLDIAHAAVGNGNPPLDSYDARRDLARSIGEALHRRGGVALMLRTLDQGVGNLPGRHSIHQFWDGIGEWRG